ncbi:ubiquitin-related domain-containing protein [Exophiala viscosa]|uniref:ubiquitin-related domain-containing protein n=1 Tax=Exophiala viscosa TaxID=2486360 RepID=UPI00219D4FDD|nr:ubiquitin-related domain-containing protein [Exophiala viscosa]
MADEQRETVTSSSPTTNTDRKERERGSGEGRRRSRSRSPRRDRDKREDRSRRKDTGFKWKEKRREEDDSRGNRDAGLQRGYRDHYRPKSRSRSPPPRRRSPRRDNMESDRPERPRDDAERKEKKEKREKKPAPAVPTQPMIIVYVNDRLGTKKAIPCFATDPIKDFKVIVASMIGRQPHEILLKRQGERPFKDQLTLQDYGVSNNVQLDLEVDTGD